MREGKLEDYNFEHFFYENAVGTETRNWNMWNSVWFLVIKETFSLAEYGGCQKVNWGEGSFFQKKNKIVKKRGTCFCSEIKKI